MSQKEKNSDRLIDTSVRIRERYEAHPTDRNRRLAILSEEFAEMMKAGLDIKRAEHKADASCSCIRFMEELIDLLAYGYHMLEVEERIYDRAHPDH